LPLISIHPDHPAFTQLFSVKLANHISVNIQQSANHLEIIVQSDFIHHCSQSFIKIDIGIQACSLKW
jgi:hypothetical protein